MSADLHHEIAERHRRAQKFYAATREAADQLTSGVDPELLDEFVGTAERVQLQLDAVTNRRRRELELEQRAS